LILVAIVGIKDPVRSGVPEIIKSVKQDSGVFVRMVTGDNMETAIAIAKECNILSGDPVGKEVMDGKSFR